MSSTEFYWPGAGWVSGDGQHLYVMVRHVRATTVGFFNFAAIDSGVAVFSLPDLEFQRIDTLPAPPAQAGQSWTGVPFRDADTGYVHLYTSTGFYKHAVRFPDTRTSFTTTQGWEYWTGEMVRVPSRRPAHDLQRRAPHRDLGGEGGTDLCGGGRWVRRHRQPGAGLVRFQPHRALDPGRQGDRRSPGVESAAATAATRCSSPA